MGPGYLYTLQMKSKMKYFKCIHPSSTPIKKPVYSLLLSLDLGDTFFRNTYLKKISVMISGVDIVKQL